MKKILLTFVVAGATSMLLADGAAIFKEYQCSICHGQKAEKKSLNVSERIAGWKAEEIVEALKAYKAKTRNKYGFGAMMGGKLETMSEAKIEEIARYIADFEDPIVQEDTNASTEEKVSQEPEPVKQPGKSVEKKPEIEYISYVVKDADTLSSISRDKYQKRHFWTLIYLRNKDTLVDKNTVIPGTVLHIPNSIDMQNKKHIAAVTESYIELYRGYKTSGKTADAHWLMYSCCTEINPKVLDDYYDMIDDDDLEKIRYYVKRFAK